MKRILSTVLCFVLVFSFFTAVRAEEEDVFVNIKSDTVKQVMKNTVMLQHGAEYAFVFGKRVELEVPAYEENSKIYAPMSLLAQAFLQDAADGGGETADVFEFAEENGLTVTKLKNTFYISKKDYTLPAGIPAEIDMFFGIYVSNEKVKGFSKYFQSIESAKNTAKAVKDKLGMPDGGLTIEIFGGSYTFSQTLTFKKEDSGLEGAPITYKAYRDQKVSFDGGISVSGSEFTAVDDVAAQKLAYPKKVVCVDLSNKLDTFGSGFLLKDPGEWIMTFDGTTLTNARWPNSEFAMTGEVLKDNDSGYSFVVDDSRMKKWAQEKDPHMFGYLMYTWYGERGTIEEIDTTKLSIGVKKKAVYGIAENKQYYVYNLLCELDAPGEFFIDKEKKILYLYPYLDSGSEAFKKGELQFALLEKNMINLSACENVTFDGITFENSMGTVMEMESICRNITVKGCVFKNVTNGIVQRGYNNVITGCDFHSIASNPVNMLGGDRYTLTNSNSIIKNCKFYDFNTVTRTNTGAVRLKGCGDTVSHNEFLGGPHTVVTLAGDENVIEYNEFYDNMRDKAADAGVIYGGRNLADQNNVVRYNYFHDIYPTMGCVYLDDSLSNQHIHDNVAINTSRMVFIHGGLHNTVKDNLVINSANTVASVVTLSGSGRDYWDTGKVSMQNSFMYELFTQYPWKTEPWQRYKEVFQYMNYDADVVPVYGDEFTGNIAVNPGDGIIISASGENVEPYVTISDNQLINDDNYEIPENYQKIIDEAGLYIDEDRKTADPLSGFDLVLPQDKTTEVEADEVEFRWQTSENANSYLFTLSTDEEFKNIIANRYVKENTVTISKLDYSKTRYYWKVTAVAKDTALSENSDTKKSRSGYFSFTTKNKPQINREKFDDLIMICKSKTSEINEGDLPGEFKEGSKALAESLVAKYEKAGAGDNITQKEINKLYDELNSKFNDVMYRKNTEVYDMATAIQNFTSWTITPNHATFAKGPDGIMKYTSFSEQRFGSAGKVEPHVKYKFSAKFDQLKDWVGFGLRAQASATAVSWSGNSQYLFIVKEDIFEYQKWLGTGSLDEIENNIVKAGEWHDYEFELTNNDDGTVRILIKIDDNTVLDVLDETNPITKAGYFEIYGPGIGTSMEIKACED